MFHLNRRQIAPPVTTEACAIGLRDRDAGSFVARLYLLPSSLSQPWSGFRCSFNCVFAIFFSLRVPGARKVNSVSLRGMLLAARGFGPIFTAALGWLRPLPLRAGVPLFYVPVGGQGQIAPSVCYVLFFSRIALRDAAHFDGAEVVLPLLLYLCLRFTSYPRGGSSALAISRCVDLTYHGLQLCLLCLVIGLGHCSTIAAGIRLG